MTAAAIEHLDFAIAEFRAMKMQTSVERALRHKELLGRRRRMKSPPAYAREAARGFR